MKLRRIILIFVLLSGASVFAVGETTCAAAGNPEVLFLHRAQKALTDVIVHDVFSPPVASRIYAYPHIAAYEILVSQQSNYPSLKQSIKNFPLLPVNQSGKISYNLAAVYSFLYTARNFIFSEKIFTDSINAILNDYKKIVTNKKIFDRSVGYGKQVGDSIIKWAAQDNYAKTRSLRRYAYKKIAGNWLPTPPAYMAAIEPYWSQIRPLLMDSVNKFKPNPPCEYSGDTTSKFYHQALTVYNTAKSLTTEQRNIALFWDCNPFFVNVTGHLVYATKKLSPGGHWLSIAGIASLQTNADMVKTAAAYTYTAIALFDGFISCWDEKYRSNYIRPETFINSSIDESWRPLLQTPPFPEYTSGHSVISTAVAVVLTKLFGDNFQFNDVTEIPFGLPARQFTSFTQAANEAAISRLYGGIHFPEAITNGQVQGRKIGENIVEKVRF